MDLSDFGYQCDGKVILESGRTGSHGWRKFQSHCRERRFEDNGWKVRRISPFYLNEWIHMFIIISTWEKKMIEKKIQDNNARKPYDVGFDKIDDESRVA